MIETARLPPIYRLVALDADVDVLATARTEIIRKKEAATLFCADRDDRLDCAVVLEPAMPLAEARLVIYVAMLGLGDALGSVSPPGIDVTFRWPNMIEANLAPVARVDLLGPTENDASAEPDWLLLHVVAAISDVDGDATDFGTALAEEGAAELETVDLLESFARHFLTWMNRWENDGFAPVRAMWLRHAPSHGQDIRLVVGSRGRKGVFEDIDDDGAMVLAGPRRSSRIPLSAMLGA